VPLIFVIHSGGEKMSYINTIDINGVVYNLGSLTDGNYEVNLPPNLKNNDVFLLQGDVVSNLVTQSNMPLAASQGKALNDKISELKTSSTNQGNDITQLRTAIKTGDSTTLSSAKSYADGKDTELDGKITALRTDMGTNDTSTLTSAKSYTDTKCGDTLTSAKTYSDNGFINKTNIADNLTTDSADKVLSAKQGKALEDKKFNKAGGTISGAVTINGALTIGGSNGISVSKVPTANNDVVNKKYVDDKISGYSIADDSITTAMIVDGAITKAKLGTDIALDSSEIGTTTEGWTYIKMSNGVAIAWGSFENSAGVGSSGEFSEAYPTGLFINAPACTPFLYASGQDVVQFSKDAGDKDNTPKIGVHLLSSILKPGTSEALGTIKIDYIAIGKWK
jgi:hypothetical protein